MASDQDLRVDRREFLVAGAIAAAALAGVGTRARACDPIAQRIPPLKLAVKYGMIKPGATVLDKFELLQRLGFEGVELDSPGGPPSDEVREAAKRTGIQVPGVVDSVHWNKTLSHPDSAVRGEGRAALEQAIRDCRAYGGGTVLLVPAVVNKQVSYADAYRRSQEEIRRVLPLAAELDIKIAIENVWNNFLLSPLEAARYIDEFESPHIGWHFDPGNVVNFGWPEDWARTLGARIVRLDIKEFSRKKRDEEGLWRGFAVEIGDGDCDWPAIMAALADIGYRGWACAEVGGGDEARLTDIRDRMRRVLAWPREQGPD